LGEREKSGTAITGNPEGRAAKKGKVRTGLSQSLRSQKEEEVKKKTKRAPRRGLERGEDEQKERIKTHFPPLPGKGANGSPTRKKGPENVAGWLKKRKAVVRERKTV